MEVEGTSSSTNTGRVDVLNRLKVNHLEGGTSFKKSDKLNFFFFSRTRDRQ